MLKDLLYPAEPHTVLCCYGSFFPSPICLLIVENNWHLKLCFKRVCKLLTNKVISLKSAPVIIFQTFTPHFFFSSSSWKCYSCTLKTCGIPSSLLHVYKSLHVNMNSKKCPLRVYWSTWHSKLSQNWSTPQNTECTVVTFGRKIPENENYSEKLHLYINLDYKLWF